MVRWSVPARCKMLRRWTFRGVGAPVAVVCGSGIHHPETVSLVCDETESGRNRALLLRSIATVRRRVYGTASMRSSATSASRAVVGVDGDLVDDLAPRQVLQRPEDVGGVDAVHRRAGADDRIEAEDVLVRQLGVEAVDQVDLGADCPGRPGGRRRDGVDDELGRAVAIGGLDDFQPALRVDDDVDARVLGPRRLDLLDREAGVDRAVALPEDQLRRLQRLRRVAAQRAGTDPRRPSARSGSPS